MKKVLSYLRNQYAHITKGVLFIISIVLLLLIFPKEGKFQYEYTKGKPWMHEDLIAPFDFAILKSEATLLKEQEEALKDLKPYFEKRNLIIEKDREDILAEFENKWEMIYENKRRYNKKKEESLKACIAIFDSINKRGIIEQLPIIEGKSGSESIVLIENNVAHEMPLSYFLTIHLADSLIHSEAAKFNDIDEDIVIEVLENAIEISVWFDQETTAKESQSILHKISLTRGMVQTGERIIATGELIAPEKYQVIESLRIDWESKLGSSFQYIGIVIGQIILLSVTMISLFLFLLFFRKEIYAESKQVLLILLLILSMVLITSLIIKFNPHYLYLLPVCLIPIIIGVFSDTRMALFVHLITIILTGLLVPNSFEFVFLQLFTGIVTILSIVKLERRSQFFLTSLMIFITYSVIYTGITLIKEGSLESINTFYFALFAGSAVLTLSAYPIIYLFEKIFGLITAVTLLELSNTNNKILRALALKAPGTFQHSMQMANLAEEAVFAIGGDPLLVRTGAMYHDIGKIADPLYFVENQTTGVNPHDELTYEESAGVIINHITGGIEMAKKLKLPEQIIDFIRTHHGTRRTEYFYTLAKRDYPDEDIDDSTYQYHGPEPFSKETAVLMMADTVEAASRSLKKPDEDNISTLVENVINKQMEAGQFDNADVTLKDIKTIKKIFKKKLMNIYHLRIEYPE
jgi:hypothetical protein